MDAVMKAKISATNNIKKLIVSVIACLTVGMSTAGFQKQSSIGVQSYSLWQLLETLGRQPSLVPHKIKILLPVNFVETKRNRYFSFHEGGPLDLADQVKIDKVELRTRLSNEREGLVILKLVGVCLPVEQVRAHYPELELTDSPRDQSLNGETSYSVQQPWGLLSFSFNARHPPCLATVVVDRT
ncbi:MAG: hypothetical protein QM666_03205 [Acinetobacter sp.]